MITAYRPMYPLSDECRKYLDYLNHEILYQIIFGTKEMTDLFCWERERVEVSVGCYEVENV